MGHQVIKLQNPLKTLGFLQFYRFKTVKDRIISCPSGKIQRFCFLQVRTIINFHHFLAANY